MSSSPQQPEQSPGLLLWRVSTQWQRKVSAALVAFDLTHPQFVLLSCCWWLNTNSAPANQVQLASFAGMDVKSSSEIIRRLESKKLLERVRDVSDTRAFIVKPTAAGAQVAKRSIRAVEKIDTDYFSSTSVDSLIKHFHRLLKDS